MAKEVRCVLFNREEVRTAVAEFWVARNTKQNPLDVARVELTKCDGGVAGNIHFYQSTAKHPALLETADLMEATLLYCAQRRIPLPIKASKVLELSGGGLILLINDEQRVG